MEKDIKVWHPKEVRINDDMQQHAEFMATRIHSRSDLGWCVISTMSPHWVARVHVFSLHHKKTDVAEAKQEEQQRWFDQLRHAERLAIEAREAGITVRQLVEGNGGQYDEEFDEPRMVVKVPDINVYLELFGCLDDMSGKTIDQQEAGRVLAAMATWYRRFLQKKEIRELASWSEDPQLLPEWCEDGDPDRFVPLPRRRGIGLDHVDLNRRDVGFVHHVFNEGERKKLMELKQMRADGLLDVDDKTLQHMAVNEYKREKWNR